MSRVAAITGAASGIGRGTAKRLLDEGWTVLALDRDGAGLEALRREFLSGGEQSVKILHRHGFERADPEQAGRADEAMEAAETPADRLEDRRHALR